MNPGGVREEIKRLEEKRLLLAPKVTGGNSEAVEEDRGLERRIMELAGPEREVCADEPRGPRRKNRSEGTR